jgi:hypothetical protein
MGGQDLLGQRRTGSRHADDEQGLVAEIRIVGRLRRKRGQCRVDLADIAWRL